MSRVEKIGRVADIARGGARTLAAPLHQAHLSPLSGMILAFLLATAVGAGVFAAYAILGPISSDDGATAPDWTPPTLAVGELDPPKPASADVETLSRPIFSKSRKPAAKAARPQAPVESVPTATAPNGLTVGAIFRGKKTSQAYLISADTPEGAWKKVGDTIDSWTIKAIRHQEVILESGGRSAKLPLYPSDPTQAVSLSSHRPPSPAPPTPVKNHGLVD